MNPTVQALVAAGYPVQRVNIDQNRPLAAKYSVQTHPVLRDAGRRAGSGPRRGRNHATAAWNGCASWARRPLAQSAARDARAERTAACRRRRAIARLAVAPLTGGASQPGGQPADLRRRPTAAAGVSDAALLAASVRLRVEDPGGHSCGSGTIIDARGGKALILTCGHIFRDSQGKGPIEVDLFGPNGRSRSAGELMSYDLTIATWAWWRSDAPGPVATARVAPPGYRVDRGMPVVSVGCNNGDRADRAAQPGDVRWTSSPARRTSRWPASRWKAAAAAGCSRSEGYVIGVCNAADPSDKEGLFAALGSIYAELDRRLGGDLSFVYKSPERESDCRAGSAESRGPGRQSAAGHAARRCPARPIWPR